MIELISTYSPDVTCFQEMVASDSFSNAINYLPYFSKKMGMKYQFYSYNRKLDFDNKHHFGIIIFSRYPIINSRTISYPPYNYNSIFQYVDIVKGNDTFRVFNIHLQTQKFDKKNRMYVENPTLKDEADIAKSKNVISKLQRALLKRKEQSDNIKREIDKSPYAVIICGDFNDVPNSYAYHSIGEGLQDVFTKKGSGIDRTFISISPTLRIDYVFCDKRFQVNQYRCLPKKMSDHFPVITDLFFNGKQLH
jgi:endonuclease/exonuclease/phosphatase family metal-dependent hydrolase